VYNLCRSYGAFDKPFFWPEEMDASTPTANPETASKPRKKRLVLIVSLAVLAVAAVGVGVYLLWPAQIIVPDLRGSSMSDAMAKLQAAHLVVGRKIVRGNPATATIVTAQSPAPAASVASGSSVDLVLGETVSVQVPSLVGKPLNVVRQTLAASNLQTGNLEWNPRSRARRDVVIQQFPIAGVVVPAGSSINLVVSGMPQRSASVANRAAPVYGATKAAPGQTANLAGHWRDAGGASVQISQSGTTLRYSARNAFGSCQGNGVVSGANFQTAYGCVSVIGSRSAGRCAGTLSGTGNMFRLQCIDSALGRTSDTFTR
jgi:hypothetical protein